MAIEFVFRIKNSPPAQAPADVPPDAVTPAAELKLATHRTDAPPIC
jgi:hypothetical protein